jgi:NADH-quinone oxidoreductase subunit M
MGLWQREPLVAVISVIAIVITASYIIRIIGSVFFGKMPAEFDGHISPVTSLDKVALVVLSLILVVLGIFPAVMSNMVQSGAEAVLRVVGGGV